MADTLAAIRSRIALKVGNKAGINSTIDENINEAILQLIQEAKPVEMLNDTTWSTSSATAEYSFSTIGVTDVLVPLYIRNNTGDYELKHTSYEVWNRYTQSTSSTSSLGDPHLWTRYQNGVLVFSRIPDSTARTLQIVYLKRPTALSADTDTFPLNDEWQRPVDELAAAMTLRDLNSSQAEAKFELYARLMARRFNIEGEENATPEAPAFIPVSNLNMVG